MRYLFDVNSLVAFGLKNHQFHSRVERWVGFERSSSFFTCSITELGFLRVLAQVPAYGVDFDQARTLLIKMKANPDLPLDFLPDGNDISYLPPWVKTTAQTTDGHLVQLAKANGAVLATLDRGIPGAFLIP